MPTKYKLTGLAVILSIACSRAAPIPFPKPVQADTLLSNSDNVNKLTRFWTIHSPSGYPQTYISTTSAVVELTSGSIATRETITSKSQFTLRLTEVNRTVTIRGSVNQFTVSAGIRVGSSNQLTFPINFAGTVTEGRFSLWLINQGQTSLNTSSCSNLSLSAITNIRRAIFISPREISHETAWTDTITTVSCHGMIPLTFTTIQTFRPIREVNHNGTRSILIEHTERNIFTGEGPQSQHRVTLRGTGAGSGTSYLDLTTGEVLKSINNWRTELTINSSGRSQQLLQTANDTTTRIDH